MSETNESEILMRMARRPAFGDRDLTIGAKSFFSAITSFCHCEEFGGNDKGVWTISTSKLSALIHASPGSIRRWTLELERAGYITVGKHSQVPNAWPLITYAVNHAKN